MPTLKIITFAILATTISSATFANSNPGSSSAPVTIPIVNNAWYVGVNALYLRPNLGGNNLGYTSFGNYGTDFNNVRVERNGAANDLNDITPDRAWGFQLNAGYRFCAANDIDINWYHFNDSTNGYFPTGTLFAGSASALYARQINLDSRWDAVNIEVGQRFDLNAMNMLRLHVGLNISRIENTVINYPSLTATGDPVFITHDKITYTGIGPRLGADYLYHTSCGLGIFAKAGASLLVGKAEQTVSGYHDLGGFNLYSTGNYKQSNNNIVIPELDANLGIKYDYTLNQGVLGFNLGYMFTTYLNAIVSQVGTGVVSSSISTSSSTNFNLNGPYLGISWTE